MRLFNGDTKKHTPRVIQESFLPKEKKKTNPPRLVFASFLVVIIIGSALLSLPAATPQGKPPLKYIDALFTATSATCVTGLIVKDTPNDFSFFGQVVILCLIQAGGLGIMTLSSFFLMLLGRRFSFRESASVRQSIATWGFPTFRRLILYVLLMTLFFELAGAFILFSKFQSADMTTGEAIYQSVFHSISAFCNAGFSLYSDSLVRYNGDPGVILTMGILIVSGGMGFIVLYNIFSIKPWRKDRTIRGRLNLQSKAVLVTTGLLLAIGFVFFLIFEWNGAMSGMPFGKRILNSLFCSITPRTAGFNTVEYAEFSKAGTLLTMVLMFIGASPGSTGGGIKTITFAVLIATSYTMIKGSERVTLFRRTIPIRNVQESIGILSIAILIIIIMATLLSVTEHYAALGEDTDEEGSLARIVFEVISAFGTVGLSKGITPGLSVLGKVIITITMFIGRIGPLMISLAIAQREAPPVIAYPEGKVMVG